MPNIPRGTPADRLAIYADAALLSRLRNYAKATGRSCNSLIVKAVERFLQDV